MKKTIIAISGIAAVVMGCSGCVGCGGSTQEPTQDTVTDITVSTQSEDSTVTTESTTTTEAQTTESEAYEAEVFSDASAFYNVSVNKLKNGFEKTDTPLHYTSEKGEYTYSVRDNMTNHSAEASLDSIAVSLTDGDSGKSGDMLYATGKNDSGNYSITVFSNIGEGDGTACYGVLEYSSSEKIIPDEAAVLLTSEYVTFSRK